MNFINLKNINFGVNYSLTPKNKINKRESLKFIYYINSSKRILKSLQPKASSNEAEITLNNIENLLSMTITKNNYKDNCKLDILGILKTHGNKLSSINTKDFQNNLMTLLNQGLIESHDYFEAIKYLSLKSNKKNLADKCDDDLVKSISKADSNFEFK